MKREIAAILLLVVLLEVGASAQVQWAESSRVVHLPAGGVATFDSVRGRTILFGGTDAGGIALNDTWEWDGTTWVRRTPTTNPPAGGAIAFDSGRARAIYVAGDTWEWDGTDWARMAVPSLPAGRLVHDSVRSRTVLLVPVNEGANARVDTWEYDGTAWALRNPATKPSLLPLASLMHATFDPIRGQTVLFLPGIMSPLDTAIWEWNGLDWRNRGTIAASPSFNHLSYARTAFFDSSHGRAVLAGAYNDTIRGLEWDGTAFPRFTPPLQTLSHWTSATGTFDQLRNTRVFVGNLGTWESDGQSWTIRSSLGYPRSRIGAAIAFHASLGLTVLFGGGSPTADTWVWDGSTWSERLSALTPPARTEHAMAYDSRRARTVLFSGAGGFQDTWEWDGTWVARPSDHRPPARRNSPLAYDEFRGRTVLFGGTGQVALNDTWEWDGTDWFLMSPATSPPPTQGHGMAYDQARRKTIMYSGFHGTWGWDGTDWTRFEPQTSPPGLGNTEMAYDSNRKRTVLFGTSLSAPVVWEWDGTNWAQRFAMNPPPPGLLPVVAFDSRRGRSVSYSSDSSTREYFAPCDVIGLGHPAGGLALSCVTPPRIGSRFTLSYPNQPSGAESYLVLGSARTVPLVLAAPTLCDTIFVWPEAMYSRSTRESPASFDFDLPPEPYLIGFTLCAQGASPEVQPAVCWRATEAVVVTVQP